MANRYWVGGTGNWTDDINHWATSSGGSPGLGNLPTPTDDVFVDANSGFGSGGAISLDGGRECHDFISNSGHSYTIDSGNALDVYGSLTLEAGVTFDSSYVDFYSVDINETITSSGVELPYIDFYGTGSWTLQDNLVISNLFYQNNGTFDANDHNVTAYNFSIITNVGDVVINMGSGTWEATGVNTESIFIGAD